MWDQTRQCNEQYTFAQTDKPAENRIIDRRAILRAGALGGLLLSSLVAAPSYAASSFAMPGSGTFRVSFRNAHTGESFSGAYRIGDRYIPEAFARINNVMRDFRTGEVYPVDPRLLDIMYTVQQRTGGDKTPFEVLSGYRSPRTNRMLSNTGSGGVATNSLHMTGQAVDLRHPGTRISRIRDIGREIKAGGVGYYPRSNFVHLDTGRVRSW